MVFELTKKDKDILFHLSLDARITITKLAKKVKLSKQVVSYRLQQLEKKQVIEGYHAIINPYALGMTHYRLFFKYQNMSKETETEFLDFIHNHEKISWTAILDEGLYAAIIIWAKTIQEYGKVYQEIINKYGSYIVENDFSISYKIHYLKYKFLTNKKNTDSLILGGEISKYKPDKFDDFLLKELSENGRATLVELANKFNTSAKQIKFRIEKLIKEKIILGFNIKLNHKLLGYTHRKILLKLNDTSQENIKNLSSYLKEHKNTIFLVNPIGASDFEFEIMTKTNDEFHDLMKELRSIFPKEIRSYKTIILYSEPKTGQLMK